MLKIVLAIACTGSVIATCAVADEFPSKPVSLIKLSAALQEALQDPEVKSKLAASGAETVATDRAQPEALRAHLKSEIDKWVPIIKRAGVQAE